MAHKHISPWVLNQCIKDYLHSLRINKSLTLRPLILLCLPDSWVGNIGANVRENRIQYLGVFCLY
ncbi:hypothetical protein ACTXKF_08705, partial [Vreelandella alkaliphila]|uniref:hypothetical protein n=1 Tax=Vreelandella alkaliphila TaxID=272774 RepID=UPI003FD6F93A